MNAAGMAFVLSAATIAFLHTVIGIDHVVPFVALARTHSWSRTKTAWVTLLCGLGHVGASVILGFAGIGLGIALDSLVELDAARGQIALWGLVGFGLLYAAWGIIQTPGRNRRAHTHDHAAKSTWALFIIFVLGPCEALVPLMMAPAVYADWTLMLLVLATFSTVTVATMLALVFSALFGLQRKNTSLTWSPVTAGLLIAASGALSTVFGV